MRETDKSAAFKDALDRVTTEASAIILSVDLDALQAAFSPGVSAPAAEGFTPSEMISFIRIAAANPKVISLGIYELNPSYDIDNRTTVLAAVLAYHFAAVKVTG
jgi:formiminoglutamase